MTRPSHALLAAAVLAALGACSPDRLQAVDLAPDTLSRQLLAHWSFDEGGGTLAHDDSGNALHGEISGGSWLEDGRFAGALHLGDGEFVSVPRFPDVASGFTVSAWVRLHAYTQTALNDNEWTTVVSTEGSGGWEVNIDHVAPEPEPHFGFWIGPDQRDYVGYSCAGARREQWNQIVGEVDPSIATASSTFTVYLNGAACFSSTTPHKIVPGSATLTMGQWPSGGRFLVGDIDDIAIWGRALVPAEIMLLTRTPPPPETER